MESSQVSVEKSICGQKTVNQQANKIVDAEIKLPCTKRGRRFASIKKKKRLHWDEPNMAVVFKITF